MAGPVQTFQFSGQWTNVDPRVEPFRIHLINSRRVDQVHAVTAQHLQIAFQVSGIAIQVFRVAKLSWVYKDAHGDSEVVGPGLVN